MKKIAMITGASSGIGASAARKLAGQGYNLSLCARREEALEKIARQCEKLGAQAHWQVADVRDAGDRERFVSGALERFGKVDVLFNNAGLAIGLDPLLETDAEDARTVFETNVLAVIEMTRLALPGMIQRGSGHLVFMGSIAGRQAYEGGSVYCASKFALRAMVDSLRQEIAEHPIRITLIDPGMVETEFSVVRFRGDKDRADSIYKGIKALTGDDIAETVFWSISQPPHVNISEILVCPVHQADARKIVKCQT